MNRRTRGMTLIEVLVALAIFATAAISVMRSVTQHLNTLSYLEEKTFASLIVDNQISRVMLSGAPKSAYSGKAQMVGKEWYWKVTPVETAVGFIAAFDVSVSLDKDVKSPIVTVRSYVDK
ncbi:type II secretion system minor pseudopilin GspI [Vibrio algarum]|uniref:Type II secretion system protein I n=1 Tax=Vibrio algarum TaxID=3020714 RepID=A0ABT4YLU8_9VIBR|nr:type II secretion system minor pseudopilin GspI [Vibrio sp. KJ40-1]MDB1122498.1 type II secretion system minor pseudopilin GspI [Vibrio sp. KJ40-1]